MIVFGEVSPVHLADLTPPTPRVDLEAADGATVVACHGEIDLVMEDDLRRALTGAIESSPVVLVDLCGCTFIDSTALHALVEARRQAAVRDVALGVACAPDDAPGRLLDLALPGIFVVYPDRTSALRALAAAA